VLELRIMKMSCKEMENSIFEGLIVLPYHNTESVFFLQIYALLGKGFAIISMLMTVIFIRFECREINALIWAMV
jgi:hypothetical protein